MKILFLSPTWTDDLGIFARIAKKRNSQPPLGILYLASVAEKRGHEVRVIDADVEDYTMETLAEEVVSGGFDMMGITTTSPTFHKAALLAKRLKSNGFKPPIIIGGEHLNIFKKESFTGDFDYGFYGESDRTFDQFLSLVENNDNNFYSIKGFIFRKDGMVIENPPAERISNLDELEFPAMHLLNHDAYIMTFARFKKRRYLPVIATRGCPFKCAFCSEPLTNPYVRFRSPENIADEIEKWFTELGISHFFFMDSNLTLKRAQIEGLCQEIIKRRLEITFEGWTRANLVDINLLKLMRKAGLIRISYGIESGDPQVLKIIHKEVSLEDMLNAFRMTEEAGIEPACSVMLGLPGDTRASVERTIDFVKNIPQILYSNFSIANPYPGTEMHEWAVSGKYGLKLLVKDFSDYRRYDDSPIAVNDLSRQDLVRLQKIGLVRMHLKPKRIYAALRMLGLTNIMHFFYQYLRKMLHRAIK